MKVTHEQKLQARQTTLLSYLQYQNQQAREQGNTEPYVIEPERSQYRLKDYGGLLFKENFWNQRNTGKGGNTLDFLVQIEGKSFTEAVEILLKQKGVQLERVDPVAVRQERPKEPFHLPEKNETFRRAIAYLTKTRGLDSQVVLEEIKKGNIYEDKVYHNAVFVGRDKYGEPVWAQKRSTLSERKLVLDQTGSDPKYTYYYGPPEPKTIVTVESPIEALSLITIMKLHNKDISNLGFLSLGGVHDTALKQYLLDHPTCKNVMTALNNDRTDPNKLHEIKGREASQKIKDAFHGKSGYYVASIFPIANDWNDDLMVYRKNNDKKEGLEQERGVEEQIKNYSKMKQAERNKDKQPVQSTRTLTRIR